MGDTTNDNDSGSDLIGGQIGKVLIEERIGRGGMGEVYRGFDQVLRRSVAVKTLRVDHRWHDGARERFRREAQLLSRLNHPCICQVYDLIEEPEKDYLVLELVKGENLRDIAGTLDLPSKLRVAEDIARALEAAHAQSVIHRDLKPENVLVDREGGVKVLDFGLARQASFVKEVAASYKSGQRVRLPDVCSDASQSGSSTPGSQEGFETQHGDGSISGTLAYMSPEQVEDERATQASDLYSFGIVLQELLTCRRAYPSSLTPIQLVGLVSRGETVAIEGLPPVLMRLIADLQSLEPDSRPIAGETRRRLADIRTQPARRRQRWIVGSLGLLSAAAIATLLLVAPAELPRELRVQMAQPVSSLDPALANDVTSIGVAGRLFSGLLRLDPELLDPVPDLASRVEVSEEGRLYTFELIEGARFHHGREITAQDFKASWQRIADPRTAALQASVFEPIQGSAAFLAGESETISGIEVLDDHRLSVRLEEPFAPFLKHLATLTAAVVPIEEVERLGERFGVEPIGSGPFRLLSYDSEMRWELEAFSDPARRQPVVEKVIYEVEPDLEQAIEGYRRGRFDIVTRLPPASLQRLRSEVPDQVRAFPSLTWSGLCFRCDRPPFEDARVRRAIALAIDRVELLEELGPQLRIASAGLLPPGMLGHDPATLGPGLDLEKARSLMAAAGYPEGRGFPPVSLAIQESRLGRIFGEFVVTSLARIGLEVELVGHGSSFFYAGLEEGRFELFGTGSVANAGDPDEMFYGEFRSRSLLNFSGFSDSQLDRLLDAGRRTIESARRAEIYVDAQRILLSEAPCTALYHARIAVLVKPRWTGSRFAVSQYPIVERTVLPSSALARP